MAKKGFTLAEVLITLGIIGVVAALVTPAVVSNLPCENKVKFLKAYSALTNVVQSLADDQDYYYTNRGSATLDTTGAPTATQKYGITGNTTANAKLLTLIASRMHTTSAIEIEQPTVDKPNPPEPTGFTTTDGTTWSFEAGTAPIVSTVTIDVDSDNKNKMKHEFILNIDKYGAVMPNSDCEKNLIATPSDLKKASFNAACP